METLMQLVITPVVLIGASRTMKGVYLRDTRAAIITSISILFVGFFVGWLITLLLNIVTLGLFWIVGLGIITRTIAYAFIIELIDQFRKDFDTVGFSRSLILSGLLAIAWGFVDLFF